MYTYDRGIHNLSKLAVLILDAYTHLCLPLEWPASYVKGI